MTQLEAYLSESHYRKRDLDLIRQTLGPWLDNYPVLRYNRILYDLWSRYRGPQPGKWLVVDTEAVMGFIGWLESDN